MKRSSTTAWVLSNMIVGVGTDLVRMARIEQVWRRWGARFEARILSDAERRVLEERRAASTDPALSTVRYLAKRFAAKEAIGKALGFGIAGPVGFHRIDVLNDPAGRPEVTVAGELHQYVSERELKIHLSLSDEIDLALAFAVVERIEIEKP